MKNLSNIEIVKGKCSECKLVKTETKYCYQSFQNLTGEICAWDKNIGLIGFILKDKKKWIQCTFENTIKGYYIRYRNKTSKKVEVLTVYADGDCVVVNEKGMKMLTNLLCYEVEV